MFRLQLCSQVGRYSKFSRSSSSQAGGPIPHHGVLLSTRHHLEGKKVVQEFGMVTGCAVHARTFWHDVLSRVVGFFGGEVPSYSELVRRATQDAAATMMKASAEQGGNCVLAVRYSVSATSDPTAGVFCYACAMGTAVRVENIDGSPLYPEPEITPLQETPKDETISKL